MNHHHSLVLVAVLVFLAIVAGFVACIVPRHHTAAKQPPVKHAQLALPPVISQPVTARIPFKGKLVIAYSDAIDVGVKGGGISIQVRPDYSSVKAWVRVWTIRSNRVRAIARWRGETQ